ncbi:MAG TPA: thioredoxin family protein [Bdellovibrionota bacterium]|jgi:thiol:disulfide interchange protein DsbD
MCFYLAILGLFLSQTSPGHAAPPEALARTKHVTAELLLENDALEAGKASMVGVRLEMEPHWHTYWRFPGDSGLPTEAAWQLPAGWQAGPAEWPIPQRIFVPPLVNYGYEHEALIGFPVSVPANEAIGKKRIVASVSWLVCKEECIPEKVELALEVKVVKAGTAKPAASAHLFAKLRAQQPERQAPGLAKVIYKEKLLGIEFPDAAAVPASVDFFPLVAMVIKGDAPPKVESAGGRTTLWLEKADPFDDKAPALPGMVVFSSGKGVHTLEIAPPLSASAVPEALVEDQQAPVSGWIAIVFAFLGGLVLNLMPCVFPVLGIKVMALVRQGEGDPLHSRLHGKAYALGVILCFWGLAAALVTLRSVGEAAGWGFQLQQPRFVAFLVLLFSLVTADLAGLIRWSGRWMGAGGNLAGREGYSGSFFTGMLAVVVATPCTAPFMGTAIGAVIGAPAWMVFLVFTSLAIGLALPFVLLCYHPTYLRVLPKPGAWMERLKEFFAFPMAATVVWLLWVLTLQVGADNAFKVELGLLVLAISVWMRTRFEATTTKWLSHGILMLGLVVVALGASGKPESAPGGHEGWAPYGEKALQEAIQNGKPVFVDFTAAWCLTCQVNRKLVLERDSLKEFFRQKGVVLLVADWTNRDPEITRALERQGRLGVPLYLVYRAGAAQPEVLPQVLTEGRIRESFP